MLALLGGYHFLHVSRIRVNLRRKEQLSCRSCPSFRSMYQRRSHWMDLREIWFWGTSVITCLETPKYLLKTQTKNIRTL